MATLPSHFARLGTLLAVICPMAVAGCGESTGLAEASIQVSTSTTGQTVDPDGYTASVDGAQSQAIGTNGSTTFSGRPTR